MNKYETMNEVSQELKEKLDQYFTNVGGDTFAIIGLPSELTGGALARYSRAKTGMQLTIVNEFLDENGNPSQKKGSAIMDRVLNAFGDESVGELEGTHVGIENVSQLATKLIEDRRIGGSPIEQSTRYVKYDQKEDGRWRYLRPKEVKESGLEEKFEQVNDRTFEVYSEGIGKLIKYFKQQLPREEFQINVERDGETVKAYEKDLKNDEEVRAFKNAYGFTTRCAALDVGRCVLPSSTLTHLGISGNGRFYTNLITNLKSSELKEEQERGYSLEEELSKVIPTFVKRNRVIDDWAKRDASMRNVAQELFKGITPEDDKVTLVARLDHIDEVTSFALFPYTNISLHQIMDEVVDMNHETKLNILSTYKGVRESRRDRTGRGLEAGYPLTFDLVGGFAEYRDLERHRMLTQMRQPLTTELGFIMPPEMAEVGLEKQVEEVVGMMEDLNSDMKHAGLITASQYATLFNHRMRFAMGMNLREFQHLSELRTQPAGHFSYRSMVQEMAKEVEKRDPWSSNFYEFVDYSDPNNKISRANEQSRIAGKNLAAGIDGGVDLE